jgi:transposase/putative transposase
MKAKRKRHEPEFKARVALEALKGLKTIQQIAMEYDIHPVQVSEWKKIMVQGAAEAFGPGKARTEEEEFAKERKNLRAKIGELTVDLDWLREKSKQLGL